MKLVDRYQKRHKFPRVFEQQVEGLRCLALNKK
jgi:hypothetical protein